MGIPESSVCPHILCIYPSSILSLLLPPAPPWLPQLISTGPLPSFIQIPISIDTDIHLFSMKKIKIKIYISNYRFFPPCLPPLAPYPSRKAFTARLNTLHHRHSLQDADAKTHRHRFYSSLSNSNGLGESVLSTEGENKRESEPERRIE